MPTSGNYSVSVNKRHYSFLADTQIIARPAGDVTIAFQARLNRHAIRGRLTRTNGSGIEGLVVQLNESPAVTQTTDSNGWYSFDGLAAGQDYMVTPMPTTSFVFAAMNAGFSDLSTDRTANFIGWMRPQILTVEGDDLAVAVDSVTFTAQPFSIFNSLDFHNDGMLRLIIFGRRMESSATLSQISLVAEDELAQRQPLEIEYVGVVPGQSFLKQINFKVPASSSFARSCINLKLSVANVSSNEARLCISDVTASPVSKSKTTTQRPRLHFASADSRKL